MFNYIIPFLLAMVLLVSGCQSNAGFESTESGLQYKFITKGTTNRQPAERDIITLNLKMTTEKDSVLMDAQAMPIQKIEQRWKTTGGIEEAFAMLSEGDSMVAKIKAGDLYQRTWNRPLPPGMTEDEVISCYIGLKEVLTESDYAKKEALARVDEVEAYRKQMLLENQEQMEQDGKIIDAYLKKNNITAQTTATGLRYVIIEEGSGEKAVVGDQVKVNYTGNVLEGEYFDTSIESKAQDLGLYDPRRPYEPYEFILGTGGVIHGWDEGIALLNKGSKAELYIPSPMAYGEQQRSEEIVPNSILKFEVELVDIKQ